MLLFFGRTYIHHIVCSTHACMHDVLFVMCCIGCSAVYMCTLSMMCICSEEKGPGVHCVYMHIFSKRKL